MKQLLLAAFLFAFTANIQAQTPKVDTVVNEIWNGTAWVNDTKIVNTYDANCVLTTMLIQDWDSTSSTWVNFGLTTYTYGSNGLPSLELLQTWNAGTSSWDDAERKTNTYDGSDKLSSFTTEIYLFGTWTLFGVTTYSYDINNYTDSVLTQTAIFGPLQNSALSVYTNNSDGTPSQILQQIWQANAWVNALRITYTYNTSSMPLTQLLEKWENNAWVNFDSTTFTYNGSGMLTSSLTKRWNGSSWDDDSRSNYIYATSCTLPLKLLVFTASRNNNAVTLSWQTAEEINTSHFSIQRSLDGVNFSSLGNVTAKGNSQTNYYGFTDNIEKVTGDKVYYRLKMIDKDGAYTYSKIIPVTLIAYAGALKTYPNPVKDQLYILFNIQNSTKAKLRITDATGKTVRSQRVDASLNNSAVGVNVASLTKGVYYVLLITDNGVQKTQFIKQ